MAIGATTVWEVRTTGSDTNGGGYSSGGTDYSQQAAAQLSVSDAACTGNTTLTSATGGFTAAMIGNVVYLSSGPGWYQISGWTDTNTITIDRAGPNASGMTCNVGGCLATLGKASALVVAGNTVHIKATATYSVAATITLSTNGSTTAPIKVLGYTTTRGDNGQVTLQASTTVTTVLSVTGTNNVIENLTLDANSQSGVSAFRYSGTSILVRNCVAKNFAVYGFASASAGAYSVFIGCRATGGLSGATAGYVPWSANKVIGCVADNNACIGFWAYGSYISVLHCLAYANSGASSDGFYVYDLGAVLMNCVSHGNGRDGIRIASTSEAGTTILNCIATANGGYGISNSGTDMKGFALDYNNVGTGATANTSGARSNTEAGAHDLAVDPVFTNSGAGDFSVGAAMRAVGYPGVFPGGLSTGYLDIGAVQHQDAGGSVINIFVQRAGGLSRR